MTKDQIEYIKDNFSDEVDTYINEKIDNELIYYNDSLDDDQKAEVDALEEEEED